MPTVNGKKFPYTPAGMKAAAAAKKTQAPGRAPGTPIPANPRAYARASAQSALNRGTTPPMGKPKKNGK
jgi:hypothetical protein